VSSTGLRAYSSVWFQNDEFKLMFESYRIGGSGVCSFTEDHAPLSTAVIAVCVLSQTYSRVTPSLPHNH